MVNSAAVSHITNKNISNGTKHSRIINVTHMIPYMLVLENIKQNLYHFQLKLQRGHSALYSGLRSLNSKWDNHYVGYIGTILDNEENPIEYRNYSEEFKQAVRERLIKENISPVFLEELEHHGHYDGYCKHGNARKSVK
jgi:trehalose-6-phosphate synthase